MEMEMEMESSWAPPLMRYGEASRAKNGEDFTLIELNCHQDLAHESPTTHHVFGVLDGHNGASAAIYAKDHLLSNVLASLPQQIANREEWLAALPPALIAGFEKTDRDFQHISQTSGTTVTLVIIDGWSMTVASIGDSRCVLVPHDHTGGGKPLTLTVDHRLEDNEEERERVRASGGYLAWMTINPGNIPVGPLRCWPGGITLSRSMGDLDVGECIIATPDVKQFTLHPKTGARLIIASDGVWDALSSEKVAKCCKRLPAEQAAQRIVKESVKARGGVRDDTTCIVVDLVAAAAGGGAVAMEQEVVGGRKRCACSLLPWIWSNARVSSSANGSSPSSHSSPSWHGSSIPPLHPIPSSSNSGAPSCASCQQPVILLALPDALSVHAGSLFSAASRGQPIMCITCSSSSINN